MQDAPSSQTGENEVGEKKKEELIRLDLISSDRKSRDFRRCLLGPRLITGARYYVDTQVEIPRAHFQTIRPFNYVPLITFTIRVIHVD